MSISGKYIYFGCIQTKINPINDTNNVDNNIENCNFLKLDCEGTEYEILENLPTSYFKKIEKIVIEYHMADSHPELLDQLKKLLISQNYNIKIKKLFPDIGFLYASKN